MQVRSASTLNGCCNRAGETDGGRPRLGARDLRRDGRRRLVLQIESGEVEMDETGRVMVGKRRRHLQGEEVCRRVLLVWGGKQKGGVWSQDYCPRRWPLCKEGCPSGMGLRRGLLPKTERDAGAVAQGRPSARGKRDCLGSQREPDLRRTPRNTARWRPAWEKVPKRGCEEAAS